MIITNSDSFKNPKTQLATRNPQLSLKITFRFYLRNMQTNNENVKKIGCCFMDFLYLCRQQ